MRISDDRKNNFLDHFFDSIFKMIQIVITLLLASPVCYTYPQSLRIPGVTDFLPLEEINGLAHNHQPRSIGIGSPSSNNLEDTVQEVEAMLKANPALPRLTRGEILDLLENITKTDQLAQQKFVQQVSSTTKIRNPKAFMVVMPYTPGDTNSKDVEDLYTKPPVTHIVGAQPSKKPDDGREKQTKPVDTANAIETGENKINKPASVNEGKKYRGNPYRRTTTPPTIKTTEIPNNYYRRRRPQPVTQQTPTIVPPRITTYSPRGRRPIKKRPHTTEKHPNHKYPEEFSSDSSASSSSLPSDGMRIISAPKLSPHAINEDLLMVEDQNKEVFREKDLPVTIERVTIKEIDLDSTTKASFPSNRIKVDVPDHLKGVVDDLNLESAFNNELPKKKPTPKPAPTTDEETRIKNMLASLGVVPSQTSTTTTSLPDISYVADNLSPDMKDLLMSFGLLPNTPQKLESASQISENYNPVKAETKPDSYIGFKPLPEDGNSRDEMEELLARYGLGRNARKQKALPKGDDEPGQLPKKKVELSFEMVPEEYKGVLEDLGLSNRNGKMIRTAPLVKTQGKQHVFSPTDNQYASQEDLDKLNNLMAIIKQLESLNRTVTEEDLSEIDKQNLKNLVQDLSGVTDEVPLNEQIAPDPLKYDYGLSKNEVKRQEENSTSTTEASAEDATPNIKDLEDSFGGPSDSVTETSAPETTTQARKTGFYYLIDWNTFLDIDDQKGKRVNLRFQPTIGDPKRFYSVSVP